MAEPLTVPELNSRPMVPYQEIRGSLRTGDMVFCSGTYFFSKAISFGMDQLTKPYDNWEILRIAVRILFGLGRKSRDRKYICSELVYEAFHKAGVEFPYNNRSISPDDLWKDPRVKVRFRVH